MQPAVMVFQPIAAVAIALGSIVSVDFLRGLWLLPSTHFDRI
jgi:hypothetical protein